ncbi:LOW QUALITY PROTEIN: hypothetical protein PHMEG_00034207 [Phytophthora megakarya]|uniref:MULE transposase domain-containing protein n=1 Tax=Phytophthora megakarya TaxID=4795 RepID=A0A225UT08_9STRA|nr:LOW QUALITY PROTEIN: hypothetical protein PHMEG_00034207 [Phytophthora megakarya]
MDNLPLRFVERKMTRKNSSLSLISEKTLKKNLMHVYEAAEARVAEELPASFGIVLDGSTFNGRHFIAIFAVFNDVMVMWQINHPSTIVTLTATLGVSYCWRFVLLMRRRILGPKASLISLLTRSHAMTNPVDFIVADNCNVNQYIGNREGALPMVDCASHRFNLAVFDYMDDYDALLTKLHALMTKLRTI